MASPTGFRHRKRRNGGLVYEFLLRRLASSLLEKDSRGYGLSLGILKKYYSPGTLVGGEKELFDVVRETRGVTELVARKVLGIVKDRYARMDHKRIEIKKSNLIKEINHSFGPDFFQVHRVPDYRLLASVQMFLDGSRPQRTITESVQAVELEEALVKYMSSRPPSKEEGDRVDPFVFSLASKKFHEKYGKELTQGQKTVLERYMHSLMDGDKEKLAHFLDKERSRLLESLRDRECDKDVQSDKIMSERYDAALKKLALMSIAPTSEVVQEIMAFERLDEEVRSDG